MLILNKTVCLIKNTPPYGVVHRTLLRQSADRRRPFKSYAAYQKSPTANAVGLFWQGHKDLNPEPTVLETAALPIELYPYI